MLAKDKEIADRWRGFEDVADYPPPRQPGRARSGRGAGRRRCGTAYPRLSHRYYALKAQWFGKDKLEHWDRNAPLPESRSAHHRVGGGAARRCSRPIAASRRRWPTIAERFFAEGWIDAPTRPGKSPGAFAHPTVPSAHPYVLLNYLGKPRDVMTLAHELGHGVHQVLAAPKGALMAPTPLTLAETASVFGEMLTFRACSTRPRTPAQRKAMLAAKVEDMINTVVRQIAFYTFERKVHLERREGELTADQLGEMWMAVQGESLGPAIRPRARLRDLLDLYPALHPFAVLRLRLRLRRLPGELALRRLRAGERGLRGEVFRLLTAGGTKHYSELLAPFGLDASDPEFWQIGPLRDRRD